MLFEHSDSKRKNSLAQDCVTTDSRPNLSEMNEFEFGFDFDENNWELLLERDDAVFGKHEDHSVMLLEYCLNSLRYRLRFTG